MKRLVFLSLLLAAGCTQGLIGDAGADSDALLLESFALTGSTTVTRTVVAADRADEDGAKDQAFRFSWTLAGCTDDDCLPADGGEARTHVVRLRATDSAGDVVYKKVTVTLYAQ